MQTGGKFVGEGTYGCVFNPPISCDVEKKYKTRKYVGKVLFKDKDFKEEMEMSEVQRKLDPRGLFSLLPVATCMTNPAEFLSTDDITACYKHKGLNVNHQIIFPDGGISIKKLMKNPGNVCIDDVYKMSIDLFKGIQTMMDSGVLHCDIKPDNIVYNARKEKMFLIDFGMTTTPMKLYDTNHIINHPYAFYPYHFKSISNKTHPLDPQGPLALVMMKEYLTTHVNAKTLRYKNTLEFLEDAISFEERLVNLPNTRSLKLYFVNSVLPQTDIFSMASTLFHVADKLPVRDPKICHEFEQILISLRQIYV